MSHARAAGTGKRRTFSPGWKAFAFLNNRRQLAIVEPDGDFKPGLSGYPFLDRRSGNATDDRTDHRADDLPLAAADVAAPTPPATAPAAVPTPDLVPRSALRARSRRRRCERSFSCRV